MSKAHHYLSDPEAARAILEEIRWPDGVPSCPHCGETGRSFRLLPKAESLRPARKGLWKCGACRKQFTVTVGTVLERSRVPLHKWLTAAKLMCPRDPNQRAPTIREFQSLLGIAFESACSIAKRIRRATLRRKSSTFEEVLAELLKPKPLERGDRLEALDRSVKARGFVKQIE